ncbi:MAG: transposase [Streptomyces sp.]|uniref:IS701 family transposase n=1 Tax=Streptomyces sp. TaxID=1931 RepID=UPI0025D1B55A|nr:transposase [Streptomyces sp.]MBW8794144.1 transposase [Streptomyces sp.]
MNAQIVAGHRIRSNARDTIDPGDELSAALFASLRRSDQRLKARHYLSGLLAAEGRKSIRNIATLVGGAAAEQSLHHFISSSTWDWSPIREALAGHVTRVLAPRAWVVRPLFIAKAGGHSVGVERQFAPEHGQVLNGQLAFGAWAATEGTSVPLQWRLHLPESWLGNASMRRRAEIPDSAEAETPDECATATALTLLNRWGVPRRPVVLDAHVTGLGGVVRPFADARIPLLIRVTPSTRLTVADRAMPGYRAGALPAGRIMESARGLRRPLATAPGPVRGTMLAAAVRVRLPRPDTGPELSLIGEWHERGKAPTSLWLAAPATAPVGDLVRLTWLARRVAQDEKQTGERVGVRDFEGRTFRGWHRHMTLASVAHAVSVLEAGADEPGRSRLCELRPSA